MAVLNCDHLTAVDLRSDGFTAMWCPRCGSVGQELDAGGIGWTAPEISLGLQNTAPPYDTVARVFRRVAASLRDATPQNSAIPRVLAKMLDSFARDAEMREISAAEIIEAAHEGRAYDA